MEEELRQKMYEMHGTVERLDEKMDSIIEKHGRLDSDVSNLSGDIEQVSDQANRNQKRLYGIFLLGGAGTTFIVAVTTLASNTIP